MADIKPVLEKVQRVGNVLSPYVLGNVAAAAALHSGLEDWSKAVSQPDWLQTVQFYGGLALFNTGILVPSIREGVGNYAKALFGYAQDAPVHLHPYAKSALLGSALAFGFANDSLRESSRDALTKIGDDVSSILPLQKGKTPKSETSKPSSVTITVDQPGIGEGDKDLESVLQAAHDSWRKLPYPGLKGQMYSRPRGVEDWAVCATDLRTGEYLVDFHCDRQQMVASANKVPIMIAFFHEVKEGKIEDDWDKTLESMIRISKNSSTNKILSLIGNGDADKGAQRAMEILESYGFTQTEIEKIPSTDGGRTLKNKSTAGELNTMLAWIYNPSLNPDSEKSFPYNDKMKHILGLSSTSDHQDRLLDKTCIPTDPSFLEEPVEAYVSVYDKTGSIYGVNINSGVLEAHFQTSEGDVTVPYALTIAVQDPSAKQDRVLGNDRIWSPTKSKQIRQDSEIIFWDLYKKYTGKSYACGEHGGKHPHSF